MKAAMAGDVHKVRSLLNEYSGQQNSAGFTALMKAISYKQLEVAKILVNDEAGASTDTGHTALMLAAQYGFVDLVKQLISAEAGQQNTEGWSALMIALNNRQREVSHLLLSKESGLSKKDGWTALMFAAQAGYADIASILVQTEKSRQSNKGWTALMIAADVGAIDVCRTLLSEAGIRRADGMTAMMIAAKNGHSDIVRLLIDKEFGLRTPRGQTAYSFALAAGNHSICSILSAEMTNNSEPHAIGMHTATPVESTMCTADLTGCTTVNNQSETFLVDNDKNANTHIEINALKRTIDILSTRLTRSNETIASLEQTVKKQTMQINELYMLVDGILQQKSNVPFAVKLSNSADEIESNLIPIPVRPDHTMQTINPDPSVFNLPPNCLHSTEFTTVPEEGVEENKHSSLNNRTTEVASSDTSLDIVCLPCEHICHFASLTQLEASRECVVCESPIDDYIEVNTK